MSIEKITSKIEGDAQAAADVIIGESKRAAWDIVQQAEKKAKEIVEKAEKKGAVDRDKAVLSRKAVAVIDGKNVTLSYKQKLIDQCFDEAVDKVTSMEKGEYLNFLTGLVKSAGVSTGEIILSKKDAELSEELIKKLNDEIPNGKFVQSKETKDIKGGVMVANGNSYYNASLDAIVSEIRDQMTAEVADVLFGGEEN